MKKLKCSLKLLIKYIDKLDFFELSSSCHDIDVINMSLNKGE